MCFTVKSFVYSEEQWKNCSTVSFIVVATGLEIMEKVRKFETKASECKEAIV